MLIEFIFGLNLFDSFEIQKKLEEFSRRATNSILMIDG
jgi:hypothetical protein